MNKNERDRKKTKRSNVQEPHRFLRLCWAGHLELFLTFCILLFYFCPAYRSPFCCCCCCRFFVLFFFFSSSSSTITLAPAVYSPKLRPPQLIEILMDFSFLLFLSPRPAAFLNSRIFSFPFSFFLFFLPLASRSFLPKLFFRFVYMQDWDSIKPFYFILFFSVGHFFFFLLLFSIFCFLLPHDGGRCIPAANHGHSPFLFLFYCEKKNKTKCLCSLSLFHFSLL